jgi:hypothetical protein
MNPEDWVWKNYDRWKTTPPEYQLEEEEDEEDFEEDDEDDQ